MKLKSFVLTAVLIITALLGGCSPKAESGKPIVAVSVVPQAAFAKAVCGDLWEVVTVIPPGSSPENYEPTVAERIKFEEAKLYFAVGVPAEESRILPSLNQGTKLIKQQKNVGQHYPDRIVEEGRDPHIWLSPKRAVVMVRDMAEEFSLADPENKDIYYANAEKYIAELNALDEYITQKLSGLENKKMIVYHPAFGYLAEDYGIEMDALQEGGRDATLRHMQEMADLAKRENIKAVFYQAETDSKQAEAFAQQIGGKAVMLAPLAENYCENLKGMADLLAEMMK